MKAAAFFRDRLIGRHLDFRVRLFNILAMAGVVVSLISAVWSIVSDVGAANLWTTVFSMVLSAALLVYATKSGRYQVCYLITVIGIFLILFPLLFFNSGGNHGGVPAFFVFAVLFTIFMLESKMAMLMSVLELAVYSAVMYIGYRWPAFVTAFDTEADVVLDIYIGMLVVSVALGVCMFLHFRLYNAQQRELEAAREEALRLSRVKSNFLANMSHEIRTPINVILGMNELILRDSSDRQIQDYAASAQKAGRSLLFLIDNILDISKIESGKVAMTVEPYRTRELIDSLALTGGELAAKHGLAFSVTAQEALPAGLVGDVQHIRQIVSNFLSNAAKYTGSGSISLSFSHRTEPEGIWLQISVADTGMGIREENLPHLFDAFARVDDAATRRIRGTGLGLAIVRELTQLMGGRVTVESTWGRGSVFSVDIPQGVSDGGALGPLTQRLERETGRSGGFIAPEGSVLVVDDNEENLLVTKSLLARTMLRVDTVGSGAACLEAVSRFRYDVILIDYMMPDMDGVETVGRLRALPGFDTPVAALTANVVAGTRQRLLDAGFSAYLSKPVLWSELEGLLRRLLPKALVTEKSPEAALRLPPEAVARLGGDLAAQGVILTGGLGYLDGDLGQYQRLARHFTAGFLRQRDDAARYAEEGDTAGLGHLVHALKSRAKAVGAEELSATAAKLERLCGKGDREALTGLMPVLLLEWQRAANGLAAFADSMDELLPPQPPPVAAPPPRREELLLYFRQNRRPDLLDALDRLIAAAEEGEDMEQLREIRRLTQSRDFREAERRYADWMEGEAVEA